MNQDWKKISKGTNQPKKLSDNLDSSRLNIAKGDVISILYLKESSRINKGGFQIKKQKKVENFP